MLKLLYFSILLLFILQMQAQPSPQNQNDKLIVSFISIGTGIDYKAKEKLLLFTEDFQRQHQVKLEVSIKNWGREGETDYSYSFTLLSKKQCRAFVKKIKEMFANNNRVKISPISLE